MIGLASGSWGQVIANNPEVAHFTIVEINPGYIQLISRETRSLVLAEKNPKVRIVIDDGRRWLKRIRTSVSNAIMAKHILHFRSNATTSCRWNSTI